MTEYKNSASVAGKNVSVNIDSIKTDSQEFYVQGSLVSLGLNQQQVDFLLEQGERFLEKPQILSRRLQISETLAKEAIKILKCSKPDTGAEITESEFETIKECVVNNPDLDSHEDIALLCDVDKRLVSKYFEMLPLNEKQKQSIKERYNKDISLCEIANLLNLGIDKVREYVEATFVTFSGEEGSKVLDIIRRNFGDIIVSSLREKIRSKNLKLQDQLCFILPRKSTEEFQILMKYFCKYEESRIFLNVDLNLSMEDIGVVKQSSKDHIGQLSTKLNKAESIISDYIHQYSVYSIEDTYYADFQAEQITEIALAFGTKSFSFDNYRMILTHSFDEIISRVENATELTETTGLLDLLPLVFYYLKCSLPFEDIARIIANLSDIILTTHDVFHLIFQLSDPVLRGLCIEHYSFSNPVPLYYPKLKAINKFGNTEFEFCKELWYCLEQNNGLISFGLGRASWNAMGKSSLLDLIFETDFVKGSPHRSAFHSRSIDIQITKNLFGEFNKSNLESTNWAYIDCHGYSNLSVIRSMCSHLDLALIHVSYHDYTSNRDELAGELGEFEARIKHIYLLIRDSDCVEVSVSRKGGNERYKTTVFIPDLTKKEVKLHSIEKSLKKIGHEIFHLEIEQPKFVDSQFVEALLLDTGHRIVEEIQRENELIQKIIQQFDTANGNKIDFKFLNFYPNYVEYMSLYHQASYGAADQQLIDKLNIDCARLEGKMKNTLIGEIVVYFNQILQRENYTLVLWKLSRELSRISKPFKRDVQDSLKEQRNDRYTLEIIWREAILSQKFGLNNLCKKNYGELLTSNFSKHVESGEAFELIDGDNLRFFNKDIDTLLCQFYYKHNELLAEINEGRDVKLKQAPIVVSIFGPQSSGKSTLLNYCFGCKFLTSAGRCTRGIYGSLSKLDRPVNLSQSFLILDTEGLDAIERENIKDTSMIHFDRTMVLFCLSVSQVVIINVKGGDIGSEMQNLLQICAYSLNRLKVNKVKAPKIFFVLNQQADPDPNKHLDSINLLMEKLNSESGLMETEGVKIRDLIQVSRENLFILPSAFNSQQVNKPGAKLFDSNVIKLSPTIAFAEKCANLRVAIVEQLDNMALDDRAPFQTMSEWMEMAGVIWDTIIKYQDIVRFRNFEELMCTNKLGKIVSDLTEKYIYSHQAEFTELTSELCRKIALIKSYLQPDTILAENMMKFDEVFTTYQDACLKEFSLKCREDSRLDKMEHICNETGSNLKRLIYVVRKQYEDQVKVQIKLVLTEIKLSVSMKSFQEAIIRNVDKYLEYSIEEQKRAFEDTWNETFGFEDLEEEIRECKENLSNLYSIFRMEYNAMEHKRKILDIFTSQKFDMSEIIKTIELDMLYRFTNVKKFHQSDQFIYPIHNHRIPIKEMIPYNGRSKFEYLCQDSLYEVENKFEMMPEISARNNENPSEVMRQCLIQKYLSRDRTRISLMSWVPDECHSLVRYISGLVSHPDITWKSNKGKQITILASSLRNPDNLDQGTWDKFIKDISSDVLKLLKSNPDVSHAVVKQIIHEFKFRIKLVNYEIGYIQAGLSNSAERTLSTFVFAYAFKFLWGKKASVRKENKAKKDAQKPGFLRYFLLKIKNRKMVRGSWSRDSMAESDNNFSQKYALDYIASVKRGLIAFEQHNFMKHFLEARRESLSFNSLLYQAFDDVSKEILKNPNQEVTDVNNFVVQFVCNRNELFKEKFQKMWGEFEGILYRTISESIIKGVGEKISVLKTILSGLISELETKAEKLNFKAFDSDSNFEIVEFGIRDKTKVNEVPFRVMSSYLKMYLDPAVTHDAFTQYYLDVFVEDGFKIKKSDTYTLCSKPKEPTLDEETFNKLVNTGMFNTNELIFNIYDYVRQFVSAIDGCHIDLEPDEFREMIDPLKGEFEKNAVGCPSQCPGCGKFCEREIHPNDGRCQIKIGHQISSMGGKVWNTDKEKTAVLFMCDDYQDHTYVIMPCGNMKWSEFKETCDSQWNWALPADEEFASRQFYNKGTMKSIWNKFGRGILDYYHQTEGTRISFVPYTTLNEIRLRSISLKYFICFVIDGTGSMRPDISRVRVSVGQLINHFTSRGSSAAFRVVVYRDHCDKNMIETFPENKTFTPVRDEIDNFLSRVVAAGGGDFPEAMLDGLATAAVTSDWECSPDVRNKVIHLFDSPPHGNFPDYESHSSYSSKSNCCCCNHGNLCPFDWKKDVWEVFRNFNIEYHGIHTKSPKWESSVDVYKSFKTKALEIYHWIDMDGIFSKYKFKMKDELKYLCGDFKVVGKEVVNEAILQIFVDFKKVD